jgi:hypothetical protein
VALRRIIRSRRNRWINGIRSSCEGTKARREKIIRKELMVRREATTLWKNY